MRQRDTQDIDRVIAEREAELERLRKEKQELVTISLEGEKEKLPQPPQRGQGNLSARIGRIVMLSLDHFCFGKRAK
jgi:hypothetical protein